jgi:hypothetical protein
MNESVTALFGILAAFGLSASAGLNAYIPLLVIGTVAHYTHWITLTAPFDILADPWLLIVVGLLCIVEMLVDKFPAVNHINDIIMTFIRPAAGAVVFAASANVVTDISPVIAVICGLLVAGGVHTVKSAAIRPAVTATTGGLGNVPVSILEDVVAAIVSFLSIVLPVLGVVLAVLFLILVAWWLIRRSQKKKAARQ